MTNTESLQEQRIAVLESEFPGSEPADDFPALPKTVFRWHGPTGMIWTVSDDGVATLARKHPESGPPSRRDPSSIVAAVFPDGRVQTLIVSRRYSDDDVALLNRVVKALGGTSGVLE